jgi:hypothetical protein
LAVGDPGGVGEGIDSEVCTGGPCGALRGRGRSTGLGSLWGRPTRGGGSLRGRPTGWRGGRKWGTREHCGAPRGNARRAAHQARSGSIEARVDVDGGLGLSKVGAGVVEGAVLGGAAHDSPSDNVPGS